MKADFLWEVSVEISPAAEEAVSAVGESLFGLFPSIYSDFETGVTRAFFYLPSNRWTAGQKNLLEKKLAQLARFGLPAPPARLQVRRLKKEEWADSWKRHFTPISISDRLLVKPGWDRTSPKRGQKTILLDPGLSFGTGHHATTQFCLEELVRLRKKGRPQSVLDVGTGSGILAIGAVKLGYNPVHAFDFDPQCVKVSRENAKKNRVLDRLKVERHDLTRLPLRSARSYDTVCANLIFDLLIQERKRLIRRVKPGGALILSGILRIQFDRVRKAFLSEGLTLETTAINGEWQSATFRTCFQRPALV